MAAMIKLNILTACVLLLTCFNGEVLSQFRFRRQQFLDKFRYKGSGPCPSVQANFTVMQDFDPERYYGKWYEQARYPVPYEFGQRCITATYTPFTAGPLGILDRVLDLEGVIRVVNAGVYNGPFNRVNSINGWATIPDPTEKAKLSVNFFTSLRDAQDADSNYWVLDTDYDTYTTVHSCNHNEEENSHIMSNWILTRSHDPEESIIDTALEVFNKFGINLDAFVDTMKNDCPAAYYDE